MTEKINPADAIRLLDAHEAVAVDVREPDEYAVGHIPGQKLESLGYTNLRDLGGILSWPYEIEGDFEGHF